MSKVKERNLKVGELLIKEGYLTPDALQKVLALQKQSSNASSYKPMGQICVELGLMSQDELQRFMRKYKQHVFLGELLLNMRLITKEQLDHALEQQKVARKRLGELLVMGGALSESDLTDALSVQLDVPRIIPSLAIIDLALLEEFDKNYMLEQKFIPLYKDSEQITVVMYDPTNQDLIQTLKDRFKIEISLGISSLSKIKETIEEYFGAKEAQARANLEALGKSLESMELDFGDGGGTAEQHQAAVAAAAAQMGAAGAQLKPMGAPSEVPAGELFTDNDQDTKVAKFLMTNAMKDRASVIHVEPGEKFIRIRYRIDGVLHHKTDLPNNIGPSLISCIKDVCVMETTDEDEGFDKGKVTGSINGQKIEMKISTYPSLYGETMVIKLVEKDNTKNNLLLSLDRTGFTPLNIQRYQNILNQPGGLIIVTGPAQTGKTTTMYASVHYLNEQNRAIITAENPVEFPVAGAIQGNYGKESKGTFSDMIYAMIQQDPDVMMVSEIENEEVMNSVVHAALSGAKVVTSFPAFDATGTLLRLYDMGLDKYLVAASNVTVLSQRLVRKLCQACKAPHTPSMNTFKALGLVDVDPSGYDIYKPVGCAECNNHGYKGQTAIHELLQINEAIREAIQDRKPAAQIRGIARTEAKLVSMAEDGYFKVIEGITSIEEVQRVAFVNEYDSQTPWEAEEIYTICSGLEPEFI